MRSILRTLPIRWQITVLHTTILALVLAARWPISGQAVVAVLVAIRMITAGWSMLRGRTDEAKPVAEAPAQHLFYRIFVDEISGRRAVPVD